MEGKSVLVTTIVMGLICAVLLGVLHWKEGHAWSVSLGSLQTLGKLVPVLLFALIGAACFEALVPEEIISNWLGKESGMKGLFAASFAGLILPPGGAIVLYGIVGGLWKAGAGIGTMVALTTSYNLLALHRLPFEISMLGWQFLLIRIASVIILAPLSGLIAQFIFSSALKASN